MLNIDVWASSLDFDLFTDGLARTDDLHTLLKGVFFSLLKPELIPHPPGGSLGPFPFPAAPRQLGRDQYWPAPGHRPQFCRPAYGAHRGAETGGLESGPRRNPGKHLTRP